MKKHKDSASQRIVAPTGIISFVEFCLSAYFASHRHNHSASRHNFGFINTKTASW